MCMRKMKVLESMIASMFVLLIACPFTAIAQPVADAEWWETPGQVFRPEELDQMLSPVALYPDALLAQVLAAATYPQGIAAADRFATENPGADSQALIDAARDTDWSPSVKSMLQFPDVLAMMNENLDWTTRLGDAFLAQQRDVMDSVQRLRYRAYEQGTLRSTNETVVRFDPRTNMILIEPANPRMVYVPAYDPTVVYGTWWYPDYPPYRYYYRGYERGVPMRGIFVDIGRGWGGWDFDWYQHRSNVRVDNYNSFVGRSYRNPDRFQISSAGGRTVANDTHFRMNAGYRDNATAQRFGGHQQASDRTTSRQGVSESQRAGGRQQVSGVTTMGANVSGAQRAGVRQFSGVTNAASVVQRSAGQQVSNRGGSEVSQAAHTAKSEGLKGQDLAQRVHEAIDTRKENRDAQKAETKARAPRAEVKAVTERRPAASPSVRPKENISAFSGVGNGAGVRAASMRGQASIQSSRGNNKSADRPAARAEVSRDSNKPAEQPAARSENPHGGDKSAGGAHDDKEKRK